MQKMIKQFSRMSLAKGIPDIVITIREGSSRRTSGTYYQITSGRQKGPTLLQTGGHRFAECPATGASSRFSGSIIRLKSRVKSSWMKRKSTTWLDNGAETSDTVNSLFKETGLLEKWTKKKKGEDISAIELKTPLTERTKKRKEKVAK